MKIELMKEEKKELEICHKRERGHRIKAVLLFCEGWNQVHNTSAETKEAAKKYGVALHYLPTYSPNLNPSERLWKVMNEHVRNNRFFHSTKEFRKAILDFLDVRWPKIALSMVDRINDNFETLKFTSSS